MAALVKQHLSSIGSDQARTAAKTRAVEGTVQFTLVNRGSGTQDGKQVLISEGSKLVALLKLPNPSYHGERFVCDGDKLEVAYIKPGVYSTFGAFVNVHQEILKDGLFGGVLSTGWALTRLEESHSKLQDQGLKKIDGKELRRVQYSPAKHSDLEIYLYFDPQSGRHVMTSYSLTVSPQMGRTVQSNARQDFSRYYLEERFDDFKESDGLQLPTHWVIEFTSDVPVNPGRATLGQAQASVSRFDVKVTNISNNATLDPKNFEVK